MRTAYNLPCNVLSRRRRDYKSQGLGHLKNGNRTQALDCFQKSIDITPEMALNVMKVWKFMWIGVKPQNVPSILYIKFKMPVNHSR